MSLPRVAIAIAFDTPSAVMALMLDRTSRIAGLDIEFAFVGRSTGNAEWVQAQVARGLKLRYASAPAAGVGASWQSAAELARAAAPDYLLVIGPNDLIAPSYVQRMVAMLECSDNDLFDMVALRSWYDYNAGADDDGTTTLRRLALRPAQRWATCSSGRIYRARALEPANWQLFDTRLNRRVDIWSAANSAIERTYFAGTHEGGGVLLLRTPGSSDSLEGSAAEAVDGLRMTAVEFAAKETLLRDDFGITEREIFRSLWLNGSGTAKSAA